MSGQENNIVHYPPPNPPPYNYVPPRQENNVVYYPPPNPPPYNYTPPPQVQPQYIQATVVPAVVMGPRVGSQPTPITCKACNVQTVTRTEFKPSLRTHMMALLLCLFGCWPCVCVPYCVESCNNVDHYCQNCGAYIGSYQN